MPGMRQFSMACQEFTSILADVKSCGGDEVEARGVQRRSKPRQRPAEPQTPCPTSETKKRKLGQLRGRLMHVLKTADGTLHWLPPSSSNSQITGTSSQERTLRSESNFGRLSKCLSSAKSEISFGSDDTSSVFYPSEGFSDQAGTFQPTILLTDTLIPSDEAESTQKSLTSPELMPCSRRHADSDSSSAPRHSAEMCMEEVSLDSASLQGSSSLVQRDSSDVNTITGELSSKSCSSKEKLTAGNKDSNACSMHDSPSFGLSPYLSSKLKPGRHILGEKKQRLYIRPGQLRNWAVNSMPNSPTIAKNLAISPKVMDAKKACRTLFSCPRD